MNKALVVFFSRAGENYSVGDVATGNTERMAKVIAETTGLETFKIEPASAYPSKYSDCTAQADRERRENARPEYIGDIENWDDYDTIYFGYPIWWGDLPMVVYNFIEQHDWDGKTVIPFNTHEGSGSAGSYDKLAEKMTGATIKDGLAIAGHDVDNSTERISSFAKDEVPGSN